MGLDPPAVWRDRCYWGDLKRIDRHFAINCTGQLVGSPLGGRPVQLTIRVTRPDNCQLFTPTSNQGRSDDI